MNASPPASDTAHPLPLGGLRVVEFTHMVMGPTCGMVLADLGAEVIKVEPIEGDRTRHLLGAGAGFFPMFNRNKKSIAIDLHPARGRRAGAPAGRQRRRGGRELQARHHAKYGLDYAVALRHEPALIYVSHKGFLPGPYEHRTALDEVVQMMGGLAYMTGRPGDPLRAGTSVNDIMGGMFGAIGVLGALIQRGITGRGMEVQSALFENNVFLVGQHMLQYAITGQPAAPDARAHFPWAVYDVFTVKDGEQIFLAAVSDAQWPPSATRSVCRPEGRPALRRQQPARAGAAARCCRCCASAWPTGARPTWPRCSSASACPLRRSAGPRSCYDDPHLLATGGLADITLPDGERAGQTVKTTLLPFTLDGQRPGVRLTRRAELLHGLGYTAAGHRAAAPAGVVA
jgi:crotonobetainyl-CoA:carnitine CoA-transferase CaiB-like acyl-CoA transferase